MARRSASIGVGLECFQVGWALGGDPWTVLATPDGNVPLPDDGRDGDVDAPGEGVTGPDGAPANVWQRYCPTWLALLILLLLLNLLVLLLTQ